MEIAVEFAVEFTGAAILAQNNFGNTRSGSLTGPIGAFLVTALAVVTVLLIRNMNKRIRRLPARFPGDGAEGGGGVGGDAGGGDDTAAAGEEPGADPAPRPRIR